MQRKVYLLNCTGIKAFCEQEGRMEELFLKVDDARRKKAEKIRDFGTACMSLAAGLLLQKVLEEYHAGLAPEGEWAGDFPALFAEITEPIQVKYRTARGGKPYFAKLRLYFNLSHSGDYCMCAVSDEEIGVDIQQQRPVEERKLAKRFFAEQEIARVESASDSEVTEVFYDIWAKKEAYGKLTGLGLSGTMDMDTETLEHVEFTKLPAPEGYTAYACRYLFSIYE